MCRFKFRSCYRSSILDRQVEFSRSCKSYGATTFFNIRFLLLAKIIGQLLFFFRERIDQILLPCLCNLDIPLRIQRLPLLHDFSIASICGDNCIQACALHAMQYQSQITQRNGAFESVIGLAKPRNTQD